MVARPVTTLFLLQSVDGKISTGHGGDRDFDQDLPTITGVCDGLWQYYELERHTDLVSLNSGHTLAKIGTNTKPVDETTTGDVSFVVVDSKPHLNPNGVEYLARRSPRLWLITSNPQHPGIAAAQRYSNIQILLYDEQIDFPDAFARVAADGVARLTIQTGGTLNAVFVRAGLIDYVSIVIAPCLIGGRSTPTALDGHAATTVADLAWIRPLQLIECRTLDNSYLHLHYKITN